MDPTLQIVIVAAAGGLVIAWLLIALQHGHAASGSPDVFARGKNGANSDVINISAIRVAGLGGLGLVAAAVGVALDLPRVGQTLALAGTLGVVMAAGRILYRRRTGPMPSSGKQSGSNTTLAIDQPDAERKRV